MNIEFLTEIGVSDELSEKIMAEYESEKLGSAINEALKAERVQDHSAAMTLLKDKAVTQENLQEKIRELKSEHPTLFTSPTPKFVSAAGNTELDINAFRKMGYRERLELFKSKPELYKKLVK